VSQVFTVELVEGGQGVVYEGDPAYHICKRLQRLGYSRLFLTVPILASGNVKERRVLKVVNDPCIVSLAAAADQLSNVSQDEGEPECRHHWIISESSAADIEEKGHQGTCKFCGIKKIFPRDPKVDWRNRPTVRSKEYQAALKDWNARLREAELQAGMYTAAWAA
jgi:hypothetical protein